MPEVIFRRIQKRDSTDPDSGVFKFAALNSKKLAIHLRKDRRQPLFYTVFIQILLPDSVFA